MGLHVPVEIDGPSARLVALAQAIQARGDLPDASAKRLVLLARSVRLFVQAREYAEAAAALGDVQAIGAAAAEEAASLPDLLARHTTPLIRRLVSA